MVEKPPPGEAPSDLAIMGRYVLAPEVFDCISRLQPGAGGELQLTDAMRMLVDGGGAFLGLPFDSGRYDTGNKLDWLRATVEVALQHPELGKGFREALTEIVRRGGPRLLSRHGALGASSAAVSGHRQRQSAAADLATSATLVPHVDHQLLTVHRRDRQLVDVGAEQAASAGGSIPRSSWSCRRTPR